MNYKFIVNEDTKGLRLDKALVFYCPTQSRTYLITLIEEGRCVVNNEISKPSYKVKLNDEIELYIPEATPLEVKSEDIPLDIIYEDDDILIINKVQGMVVHPAAGHTEGTLVNAILHHCTNLSGIGGVMRPGIVHRIDKDTSGLICVAKNDNAHHALSDQLRDHSMSREYIALVKGVIKENNGMVNLPIGRDKNNRKKQWVDPENGKEATTYFHVEKRYNEYTLITCKLKTGRTHQIRVHMAFIGYPVEGDQLYGRSANRLYDEGQLLHAYKLTLVHPSTKKEMTFEAPLPDYFSKVLENLK